VEKVSESPNNNSRALVASSLWLHLGLIGATALAAGLLRWFDSEPRLPWSPLVALFGALLAVASFHRGFAALEQAERESAVATDTSSESTVRVLQSGRPLREGAVVPPVVPCPAATER
jgi:hypothetical protein